MSKPLTKALHTVRVVEQLARFIVDTRHTGGNTPEQLFKRVLLILDNELPVDAALRAQCVAVCKSVLGGDGRSPSLGSGAAGG